MIVAGCWACPTGTNDRTYRWISTNNGTSFSSAVEIGTGPETNGSGAWLEGPEIFVGASAANVKAALVDGEFGVQFATGGLFVYGPQVVRLSGTNKLVAASNDLAVIKYGVFDSGTLNAANINNASNWEIDKTLPSPEPDNSDSNLNTGPNGVDLTYRYFVAGDTHLGLRHFDPATNTFGGSTFIEGNDPIEDASLGAPDSYQDPSGRIHVVWTSLFEGGRLRYTVSNTSGGGFSTPGTLAKSESFYEPEVAAGADGRGFATWTQNIAGDIRVVPLDPQAESGAAPNPHRHDAPRRHRVRDRPLLPPSRPERPLQVQLEQGGPGGPDLRTEIQGHEEETQRENDLRRREKRPEKKLQRLPEGRRNQTGVAPGDNTIAFNGKSPAAS